jgi:hypothetical protein
MNPASKPPPTRDTKLNQQILAMARVFPQTARNIMAHGKDNGGDGLVLIIESINRAGREVEIKIDPDSHQMRMEKADALLTEVRNLAKAIR